MVCIAIYYFIAILFATLIKAECMLQLYYNTSLTLPFGRMTSLLSLAVFLYPFPDLFDAPPSISHGVAPYFFKYLSLNKIVPIV
jgi:hypothetical protein